MCHSLVHKGAITVKQFCDPYADNCGNIDSTAEAKNPINVLEGQISHIHYVREKYDARSYKETREAPSQHWKTYRKFLQYKYFVANRLPTVITEGPSDVIYIKLAISRSKLNLKNLNIDNGKEVALGVHLMKHSGNAAEILGLTGGTGNIQRFLSQYAK